MFVLSSQRHIIASSHFNLRLRPQRDDVFAPTESPALDHSVDLLRLEHALSAPRSPFAFLLAACVFFRWTVEAVKDVRTACDACAGEKDAGRCD